MIDELHTALVDAIAAEHRLRRQAVRESKDAEMWRRREELARERNLTDMAEGARARAERHARMQEVLLERANDIHSEIERMRGGLETTRSIGRAPPRDDLEARFAVLEVESELDAIHASARPGESAEVPARTKPDDAQADGGV